MAAFTITSLVSYFNGEPKSINRGENHYKSDHVQSFSYFHGILRGSVQASMKDKVYKVTICVDDQMNIKSTECECPRGEVKCSHAAALYIHAIHNVSRTDVECQWKKQKPTDETPKAASELFPPPKSYNPLSREPNDEDRRWLYSELSGYGMFTGMWWLMSPEPYVKPQNIPAPVVTDVLVSEEFLMRRQEERKEHFITIMKIDIETKKRVVEASKGQRLNDVWHVVRKGRLTASNFGAVIEAKKVTNSLKKRLMGEYDLSGVKSVSWGIQHEAEAITAFNFATGLTVEETGIWLDESGLLGASPDGLVGSEAVLEVKCPYTIRHDTIEDGLKLKTFCLLKDASGALSLKRNHFYWHQVQGQMYLTNRSRCYFVVWTKKDMKMLKIERDPSWANNFTALKQFYMDHMFQELTKECPV